MSIRTEHSQNTHYASSQATNEFDNVSLFHATGKKMSILSLLFNLVVIAFACAQIMMSVSLMTKGERTRLLVDHTIIAVFLIITSLLVMSMLVVSHKRIVSIGVLAVSVFAMGSIITLITLITNISELVFRNFDLQCFHEDEVDIRTLMNPNVAPWIVDLRAPTTVTCNALLEALLVINVVSLLLLASNLIAFCFLWNAIDAYEKARFPATADDDHKK